MVQTSIKVENGQSRCGSNIPIQQTPESDNQRCRQVSRRVTSSPDPLLGPHKDWSKSHDVDFFLHQHIVGCMALYW